MSNKEKEKLSALAILRELRNKTGVSEELAIYVLFFSNGSFDRALATLQEQKSPLWTSSLDRMLFEGTSDERTKVEELVGLEETKHRLEFISSFRKEN